MVAKLNQILAFEKGEKTTAYGLLTELNKRVMKTAFFDGFKKTYRKLNEDDLELPGETKLVQLTAPKVLQDARDALETYFTTTARKDWTNCIAKASITLDDGTVLLPDVPVTYLLFLEKQVTDLRTLAGNIPVLDFAENWQPTPNASGLFQTPMTSTQRTQKVVRPIVLLQPTVEHPGQAELVSQDVVAGFWELVKTSGAMPEPEKKALLRRIDDLLKAIKKAREAANSIDETQSPDTGKVIFDHLFGN